jgi:hypothetical protein
MTPKSYSIMILASLAVLFFGTMAANIVLDPEYVFRTNIFPRDPNRNERIESLRRYQASAEQTDALLFSSSRGSFFDLEQLRLKMGANHVASFAVSFGLITDHLPALEYVLKDKQARGQKLKAVFLLLDLDFFGKTPWTNNNLNSLLPPELDGGSSVAFWWRHLTAFQYKSWREVIRLVSNNGFYSYASTTDAPAVLQGELVRHARPQIETNDIPPPDDRDSRKHFPPTIREDFRRAFNSIRPDMDRQLGMLQKFVELCAANNVQLAVAVSPMTRKNLDTHEAGYLDKLSTRLSRVVSLFDFNAAFILADRPRFWEDFSHFDDEVAAIMLNRVFSPSEPSGFGLYRKAGQSRITDFGR